MRAAKINPELSKYANSPIALAQVARAKAILDRAGLPPQILSNRRTEAAVLCHSLKDERTRQHLTQSQLAERVGMQKEFISRIENGHVDVQLSTFLKVAEGLGLKVGLTA